MKKISRKNWLKICLLSIFIVGGLGFAIIPFDPAAFTADSRLQKNEWQSLVEEVHRVGTVNNQIRKTLGLPTDIVAEEKDENLDTEFWKTAYDKGEIQNSYTEPKSSLQFPGLEGYDEKSVREYFKNQPEFFWTKSHTGVAGYLGTKVSGLEYDWVPNGLGDKEILLYVVAQPEQKTPVYRKDLIRVLSGMKDFAKRGIGLDLIENFSTNDGFKRGGEYKESGNIMANNRMEWTMNLFGKNLAKITTSTVSIYQLVDAMIPAMEEGFSADLSDEQIHLNLKKFFEEELNLPGRKKPVDANW